MRIKSLELRGFKSFYEQTTIEFHHSISAIVGPNGCGKSNILDAICWVLGEQNPRRLRAGDMVDLISNGGELLKPLGMAEVSLVITDFPGQGFNEVAIKRRLFRSGESEYYINGVPCRLKDITELFLDTGIGARSYSIISQGRVEHIITAKPEERRLFIEEVAGIVKYKTRRRETESKIESTKENLKRVRDLALEVRRQMQALGKQARDAEEFRFLSERARNLEAIIAGSKLRKLRDKESILKEERAGVESLLNSLEMEAESKENALNELRSSLRGLQREIEGLEGLIYETKSKLQTKESLINLVQKESASVDEFIDKLEKEIDLLKEEERKIEGLIASRRKSLEATREELIAKESRLMELEGVLSGLRRDSLEGKNQLETIRKRLLDILDRYSSLKGVVFGYEKELAELKSRRERLEKELKEVFEEKTGISSKITDIERALKQIEDKKVILSGERIKLEEDLLLLNKRQELLLEKSSFIGERLKEVRSRLDVLQQIQLNYEWLPEEIRKFILERKGNGVLGIIADFISVQEGYERAVESAIGERLNWVVVDAKEEALEALEYLKRYSTGKGTFISLDLKTGSSLTQNGIGALPLSKVVRVEGIDGSVVENMLEGIYVVSSLGEALRLWESVEPRASFVTPDGDFLHSTGAISGGFAREGFFERKKEIERLLVEASELERELSGLSTEIESNRRDAKSLEEKIGAVKEELRNLEIREAEMKKDVFNLRDNLSRASRRFEVVDLELNEIASEMEDRRSRLLELSEEMKQLQDERSFLEERFKLLEGEIQRVQHGLEEKETEISSLRVDIAALREKERGILEDIGELENRKRDITRKIEAETKEIREKKEGKLKLLETGKETRKEVETLLAKLRSMEEKLVLKKQEKDRILDELGKLEEYREELKRKAFSLREKLNSVDLDLNSMVIEIEHIRESISRIGIGEENAVTSVLSDLELEEKEREFRELQEKIEGFGPVNLLAPEEYKVLEERARFLDEQIEDLTKAISSLKRAINRIDRESEKRFMETFEDLNRKFGEIFGRLFKGGEARLALTDPDDVLQTGVEVMVKPGGKRFQSLSLLSGGEKALSAIALVLSAGFVKNTPFFFFDEVDAPLDDINTARFVDLLREIAKESQVIVITHNKKTMQAVDSLIGITSEKPGVSKVVSVELKEL
jgi:chromosome segregation protein